MGSTPGFEPGPYWWEASALNTAPLRIFVSSGAVHCFVAAAKVKFQTGQNLSVNLSVLTNRQNLSVVGLSVHVS